MRQFIIAFSAISLLSACGGGGDGTTPPVTLNPAITLSASASSGTVARGSSGTTSLSLGRVDGFAGTVSLAAEGVPSGVTVQFAPQQLSGGTSSSTATITVGATAAPGSATITFRASGSGVTDKTAQYTLTVPAPAITLALGTSTASAAQGATATVPVSITRVNGAAGTVTLTAEGLPTNVTASFAPATIGASDVTSTMTLTVGATAAVAASTITVRATSSGVTDQTATVQLTVTGAAVPGYSMTASPASLSVVAGQSGQSTVTVAKSGGFTGAVTLSLESPPTGISAAFAPNPATGTTSTLTISTTSAAVPGTYNLTIKGTATGLTDRTTTISVTVAPVPGISMSLAPTSLNIAQGASGQTVATLARLGGLTGDIQMTATGAPAGMTVAFAPTAVTGTSSTATVTVASSVAAGTYTVNIVGTGTGNVTASAALAVTVSAPAGFSLAATAVSVSQGGTGVSTVTITRTGGFANTVNLTATNLPANVTASFNPAGATGTTSALTFTVASGATPGTYSVAVNGTGTGATNQTTNVSLTVTATGGGGAIAWRFCDASRVPLWFAFRNGTSGSWTRVTASGNNTFSFSLSGAVGAVAYVLNSSGGGTEGTVYFNSAAELSATALSECESAPATKSLSGSVTGLATLQSGNIYIGAASGTATFPITTYQMTGVPDRLADLIAIRSTINIQTFQSTPDRMLLRRGVNYPAGGTVPLIDFNGSESFAVASATYTLANTNSEPVTALNGFATANGAAGSFLGALLPGAGTTTTVYGVPSARTQAGDFHQFIGIVTNGDNTSFRQVFQYNRDLANRTITFGGTMPLPTITTAGSSPYARLKVRGAWQSEYGEAAGTTMSQTAGTPRSWTLTGSRTYFGGGSSEFEYELPDFSGVAGFLNAWGLTSGVQAQVTTNAIGPISGSISVVAEGTAFKAAARIQNATP